MRFAVLIVLAACGAQETAVLSAGPFADADIRAVIKASAAVIDTKVPGFAAAVFTTEWHLLWQHTASVCGADLEGCLVPNSNGKAVVYVDPVFAPTCVAGTALPHELIHLAQYIIDGVRDVNHTTPGFWDRNVSGSLEQLSYAAAASAVGCTF